MSSNASPPDPAQRRRRARAKLAAVYIGLIAVAGAAGLYAGLNWLPQGAAPPAEESESALSPAESGDEAGQIALSLPAVRPSVGPLEKMVETYSCRAGDYSTAVFPLVRAADIAPGQPIYLYGSEDRLLPFSAYATGFENRADGLHVTLRFEYSPFLEDGQIPVWRRAAFVAGTEPVARRLPLDALQRDDGGALFVWIARRVYGEGETPVTARRPPPGAEADDTARYAAQPVPVELGLEAGSLVDIREGARADDLVLLPPPAAAGDAPPLTAGQPVRPKENRAFAPPALTVAAQLQRSIWEAESDSDQMAMVLEREEARLAFDKNPACQVAAPAAAAEPAEEAPEPAADAVDAAAGS